MTRCRRLLTMKLMNIHQEGFYLKRGIEKQYVHVNTKFEQYVALFDVINCIDGNKYLRIKKTWSQKTSKGTWIVNTNVIRISYPKKGVMLDDENTTKYISKVLK